MSEKEGLIPDFDFEVDSPVLEDNQEEQQEETTEVNESQEKEESTPTVATDFNPEITEEEQESSIDNQANYGENADPNVVAAYQLYKDKGIIQGEYEDFDGTPESLQEIMLKEDERKYGEVYDYIVGNSPDFAKNLVELILNKGADTTKEEVQELFQMTQPSEISAEDLESEEGAVGYLKKHYMTKYGDSEEEAEERIDLLKDRDKLNKEAKTIWSEEQNVKQQLAQAKIEKAKETKAQKEARQKAFEENFVNSIREQEWRDDLKQQVAQEFYSGNFKKRMDHIFNNPKALSQLVNFMRYYDGNRFNMSEFEKSIASKVNKKRKDNIQNYWSTNVGSGGVKREPDSDQLDLTNYEIEL